MARRFPRRMVFAALAALLLSFGTCSDALAGHDMKEAWSNYQGACSLHKANVRALQKLKQQHEEKKALYRSHCKDHTDENVSCVRIRDKIADDLGFVKYAAHIVSNTKLLCDANKRIYVNALTETLTTLVLSGGVPEPRDDKATEGGQRKPPTATVKKPRHSVEGSTRRTRRNTVRTTRRPQQGHTPSQTQALAVIGGLVIQGISRGTKKGSRGGSRGTKRPNRGTKKPSRCPGGRCPIP